MMIGTFEQFPSISVSTLVRVFHENSFVFFACYIFTGLSGSNSIGRNGVAGAARTSWQGRCAVRQFEWIVHISQRCVPERLGKLHFDHRIGCIVLRSTGNYTFEFNAFAFFIKLPSLLSLPMQRDTFYRLYSFYCQNIPRSERLRETLVDTHLFLQECQKRLGHKLPLAAYLLKPVQRITKYQLLLKDLLRYVSEYLASCLTDELNWFLPQVQRQRHMCQRTAKGIGLHVNRTEVCERFNASDCDNRFPGRFNATRWITATRFVPNMDRQKGHSSAFEDATTTHIPVPEVDALLQTRFKDWP